MVVYPSFDEAVQLCINAGKGCKMAKSDMSRAFRNVPLKKNQWFLLVMKAEHPITGVTYYFIDKCLPFGSSISCAIFQRVSNTIVHIVKWKTKKGLVNYLDDYFFAALYKAWCDGQVDIFLEICEAINFPVAEKKTVWGSTLMTFLGMLLDSENQLVCVPVEKIRRAQELIRFFLNKRNKKATVLQYQKICGFLNFLCRSIVPGRAFMRRLYAATVGLSRSGNLKPHYHVRISEENRMDLLIWQKFLEYPMVFARPFMEFGRITAEVIDMYSDASRNFNLGFGAYCGPEWSVGQWNRSFMEKYEPSIEYLELYALLVGVLNWIKLFKNKKIVLFCDNEAVVHMVNNNSSTCKHCMQLIRIIVLECMVQNVRVLARHVGTKDNGKADALSRLDFNRFRRLGGHSMNKESTKIPENIWPLSKIWY